MPKRRKKGFINSPWELLAVLLFAGLVLKFILQKIAEMFQAVGHFIASITIWEWLLTTAAVGMLVSGGILLYRMRSKKIARRSRIENLYRIRRGASIDKLRNMNPYEFEHYVADLFRGLGYQCDVTSKSGDGGKDIIMRKDGKTYLAECKRYTSTKVGRPDIQKLHSVIIDMNAAGGFFVTTGSFTPQAISYARGKMIELIDESDLLDLIEEVTEFGAQELR